MPTEKKALAEKTRMREKERVQLDFAPEALQRLDLLKEETGASTRAETIRQALRLYDWFIHETQPDSTIQITDREGNITSIFKASLLHSSAPRTGAYSA